MSLSRRVARSHLFEALVSTLVSSLAIAHEISIEVIGARSSKGYIAVAIYCDKSAWLQAGKWTAADRLPASQGVRFTITGIPSARCAISAFHDENANDQFDRNLFGIPTEPYGYSRGVRPAFRPAKFEECALDIIGDTLVGITVE